MLKILKIRLKQGNCTIPYPFKVKLPERFRGLPRVYPERCGDDCKLCADACPINAISLNPLTLDIGRCIFCENCVSACPNKAIEYSDGIKMSVRNRSDLLLRGQELKLAEALEKKMKKLLGRSLKLRVVTAGSCNGCEMELNAVNNIQFDLSRFGVQIVASPRHADGVIVTGPVTNNMKLALEKTFAAVPEPKIVIAVGACAINGGPFEGSPHVHNGADKLLPVDLYIPGCPPHPLTIIDGILRLLGRE
ncbi:MAG: NADH-quinone oxidoreductase subunit NuoB [Deltaproteobacteria bacterium]|nr:NADH-quinone oxidoreductase subunit NuoB [Deltaproteobacteria bacterium]MBI2974812.1 NADH-quinone oxidoreductase subunit NuoB [Deltaproteobacteria bacterium]